MILVVGVSERNQRKISAIMKKIEKVSKHFTGSTFWLPDGSDEQKAELETVRDVREVLRARAGVIREEIFPIQGVYVPLERFEQFYLGLQKLAQKFNIPVPIQGSALTSTFEILAEFDFSKVSDRRKSLDFLAELNALLATVDGELGYGSGEGRLYGLFVTKKIGHDEARLYEKIRNVFDPMGILNIGVKSTVDPKVLVNSIRNGK